MPDWRLWLRDRAQVLDLWSRRLLKIKPVIVTTEDRPLIDYAVVAKHYAVIYVSDQGVIGVLCSTDLWEIPKKEDPDDFLCPPKIYKSPFIFPIISITGKQAKTFIKYKLPLLLNKHHLPTKLELGVG